MTGHDDKGKLVPAEEFDYELALQNVFESAPEVDPVKLSPAEMEAALAMFEKLLKWQFQDGMKNPEGLKIRSIICCWIFLKVLRPMTLTQLATGFGMKKQSLGRWVDQFKRDFPDIKTVHMRNLDEKP